MVSDGRGRRAGADWPGRVFQSPAAARRGSLRSGRSALSTDTADLIKRRVCRLASAHHRPGMRAFGDCARPCGRASPGTSACSLAPSPGSSQPDGRSTPAPSAWP